MNDLTIFEYDKIESNNCENEDYFQNPSNVRLTSEARPGTE